MRTRLLAQAIILLLGFTPLVSHPGIGIVMDSKGNIFYTDLKHVWKLTPDGAKSIAVRDVHTHELYIDPDDYLFGEHLWYEGERTNRWGHRVWRLSPDGALTDIIPARHGLREDYSDFFFVRDQYGTMYWADRKEPAVIRKRSTDGTESVLAREHFRDVRWMTVTPAGIVFLIDRHDLIRISPDGTTRTVARNIADRRRSFFFYNEHAVMGLCTDREENVYAAVMADGLVRKIRPDGHIEVATRSESPWSPTSLLVAPNGDLLVLEYTGGTTARVRRIDKRGTSIVYD
jgi:hypothetical protein